MSRVSPALVFLLLASVGVLVVEQSPTSAAPPVKSKRDALPADSFFANPQQMAERMFGPETEEDRKRLDKIPVSIREEREMGEAAVGGFLDELKRRKITLATRGREARYLRDLVDMLRPLTGLDRRYSEIEIYYVQSEYCEARSFPGGTLFFFQGLLETAENEAAVVGIVGHELSHLVRGHHLTRVRRIKLARQTFSTPGRGAAPQKFLAGGMQMFRLFGRPFQPEAEAEADADGARWAYQAGYDPRPMAGLIPAAEKRNHTVRLPLPEFLLSHPPAERRQQDILKLFDQLQRDDPKPKLYLGQENLKQRMARVRKKFPE